MLGATCSASDQQYSDVVPIRMQDFHVHVSVCWDMVIIKLRVNVSSDVPGGSDGKESACSAGNLGMMPGWGRSPGGRAWRPTPVFLPGEFHGQRSLAVYSPWGCKESDTTEKLMHTHQAPGFQFLHILSNISYFQFFNNRHANMCDVVSCIFI